MKFIVKKNNVCVNVIEFESADDVVEFKEKADLPNESIDDVVEYEGGCEIGYVYEDEEWKAPPVDSSTTYEKLEEEIAFLKEELAKLINEVEK